MNLSTKAQFSIVVPTYNPEERILSRVVAAIESLVVDNALNVECAIVDNNSDRLVKELPCIKGFLDRCSWAKAIREPRQGITFARIAGIKATTAPLIIFFDDDNEPSPDYLRIAYRCLEEWPSVAIWGPGTISVEFLDPVPDNFRRRFRGAFNERHQRYPEYGCVQASCPHYYPIGMGQVIRRQVAERYMAAVEGSLLTSTDRSGGSLASAGDLQLVWEAVKMGQAAGVHPQLQLNHLIPARRSNIPYVKRLAFGCSSSYAPALVESFPSERANVSKGMPSNAHILKRILQITSPRILRFRVRDLTVELAHFLGQVVGVLRVARSKKRQWVFGLVKVLKLE
jgi:hypothetical protein